MKQGLSILSTFILASSTITALILIFMAITAWVRLYK